MRRKDEHRDGMPHNFAAVRLITRRFASSALDLYDGFDLDRYAVGQRGHADGRASVPALVSKDLGQQVRATVCHGRLLKEGKYALNWTRLSCHKFVANQVRLGLFILAYNCIVSLPNLLGNFMRRLVLPEDMKHWTLTSLQTRLIKTGGRLVRHARRLVFQFRLRRESSMKSGLAEVLVTREMLTGILEHISQLRLAPG